LTLLRVLDVGLGLLCLAWLVRILMGYVALMKSPFGSVLLIGFTWFDLALLASVGVFLVYHGIRPQEAPPS
jgi:hypothetical protein